MTDKKPSGVGRGTGSSAEEPFSELATLLCYPAALVALIAIVLSLLGFMDFAIGEACANLRAQLIIVLLLCMLPPLFSTRRWRMGSLMVLPFLLVNVWYVAPVLLPQKKPGQSHNLHELRFKIVQLEVDANGLAPDKVASSLGAERADIVCLENVTEDWLKGLKKSKQGSVYKHTAEYPDPDNGGLAVLSRVPLEGSDLRKLGGAKIPLLVTALRFDFGHVRLIVVKLPEPFSGEASFEQRAIALDELAQMVASSSESTIVTGNFNMTPYAESSRRFLSDAKLLDTRTGSGVHPNCFLPRMKGMDLWINRFPMDHIYLNDRLATYSRKVIGSFDSFHKPIVAELYPASVGASPKETAPIKTEVAAPHLKDN